MRGQWESSIRRLNRHYQSAIPPFEPPKKAVYHGSKPIQWSSSKVITDWIGAPVEVVVTAIGPDWGDRASTIYDYWAWGEAISYIEFPKTIEGVSNSITYINDYINVQTVYGIPPSYETPYFGGSSSPFNVLGGASRSANSNLELTVETNTTAYITEETVKTDPGYSSAGERRTYTFTDENTLEYSIQAAFYLLDVDDTTNYINVYLQSMLKNSITKTVDVLNANSWSQNRVPRRYKVVFIGGTITSSPSRNYYPERLRFSVPVEFTGFTDFTITLEEV